MRRNLFCGLLSNHGHVLKYFSVHFLSQTYADSSVVKGKWPDPGKAWDPELDLGWLCYEGVQSEGFTLPLVGQLLRMYAFPSEPPFPHLADEPRVFTSHELHEEGGSVGYPCEFILVIFCCASLSGPQNQELSL